MKVMKRLTKEMKRRQLIVLISLHLDCGPRLLSFVFEEAPPAMSVIDGQSCLTGNVPANFNRGGQVYI